MKDWKKYMTFVLALVICLGLAACGGSDYNGDNSSDPSEIEDAAYDAAADETVYDADLRSMGDFEDLAGVWYLDDEPAAGSIEIDADGTWILYECPGDSGKLSMTDYGYLERHQSIDAQCYAYSSQFEGIVYEMVLYDMLTSPFDDDAFLWGDENVSYVRRSDSTGENPAEQLGYRSVEEMRIQEHEIIASDDENNTVAEGYWYPDGDRNSSTYIKIQRDTLYWYEFDPEQGDVQTGEPDGIVFKLGSKRRLKSGATFTYTDAWDRNDCKLCFEDDTVAYYWRER